jgi:hypothetical protein
VDEIERILNLREKDYDEESRSVQQSIAEHTIDNSMKQFLEIIDEAKPVVLSKKDIYKNYFFGIARKINLIYARGIKLS